MSGTMLNALCESESLSVVSDSATPWTMELCDSNAIRYVLRIKAFGFP